MIKILPYLLTFFAVFAMVGGGAFYIGCIFFSTKFKRPFLYFEIKRLAIQGDRLARALIMILHIAILFSVLFFCFGLLKFF